MLCSTTLHIYTHTHTETLSQPTNAVSNKIYVYASSAYIYICIYESYPAASAFCLHTIYNEKFRTDVAAMVFVCPTQLTAEEHRMVCSLRAIGRTAAFLLRFNVV